MSSLRWQRSLLQLLLQLLLLLLATWQSTVVPHPTCASSLPEVRVGVLYSSTGAYADTGVRTLAVLGGWVDLVNAKAEVLGFQPLLLTADVQSDATLVPAACAELLAANATILIAPESTLTIPANACANEAGVPILSRIALTDAYRCVSPPFPAGSNCQYVGDRAYASAFTVLQPASVQMRDYFSLVRVAGAQTVAVVYFDDGFHFESCMTGSTYAQLNRLHVLETYLIPTNYTDATIRSIVSALQALNPDVVTWCHRLGCAGDIAAMKAANYLPRSLIMLQCTDTPDEVEAFGGENLRYVAGTLFWSSESNGPVYSDNAVLPYASHFPPTANASSSALFAAWLKQRTGSVATWTDASTFAVGYSIEAAVMASAPLLSPSRLVAALGRVNLPSFWGSLVFDADGQGSLNAVIITQLDATLQLQLISPISTATAGLIYPMPTWTERIYVWRYASTMGARICCALLAMCVVLYGAALALVVTQRRSTALAGLSALFVCTSLVGAMLLSCSLLTWLDENNALTCAARIPLMSLGLLLLALPMVARSWALHRAMHNRTPRPVSAGVVGQIRLLVIVGVPLVGLTVVFCSLWPLRPTRHDFDALRPALSLTVCAIAPSHQEAALRFGLALAALWAFILLLWMLLAARNRNIRHPLLAESQRILLAVCLLVFLLGLVAAVEFAMAESSRAIAEVKQVVRNVGLLASVLLCVLVLYGGRLLQAMHLALYRCRRHRARARVLHPSIRQREEPLSLKQSAVAASGVFIPSLAKTQQPSQRLQSPPQVQAEAELASSLSQDAMQLERDPPPTAVVRRAPSVSRPVLVHADDDEACSPTASEERDPPPTRMPMPACAPSPSQVAH